MREFLEEKFRQKTERGPLHGMGPYCTWNIPIYSDLHWELATRFRA